MNYKLPTTKGYLSKFYTSILQAIHNNKDVHLSGFSETGKSFLLKLLAFSREKLPFLEEFDDTVIYFVGETFVDDEIVIWHQLAEQMNLNFSDNAVILFSSIISNLHRLTREKDKRVGIVLNQFFSWNSLSENLIDKLFKLKTVYSDRIKFIFVSNTLEKHRINKQLLKKLSTLNIEEINVPKFNTEDTKHQILVNRYDSNLNKSIDINRFSKNVFKLSGGIPGIIKKLALLSEKEISKTPKQLLQNEVVFAQICFTLRNIPQKYLKMLKSSTVNQELYQAGLTDKKGVVKSSLIKYLLKNFDFKSILANEKPEDALSPQEEAIYKRFKEMKGTLVSREDLAKIMWDKEYKQRYSDWAIDSVIKRLRRKLPFITITTIRKKGFSLR